MAASGKLERSCKTEKCNYGEYAEALRPPNPNLTTEIIITITSWYDQKQNYNFSTGKIKSEYYDRDILGFTALIWKETTKVGIGASRKSDGYIFIAVQFSPAGNVDGGFLKNVIKSTKEEDNAIPDPESATEVFQTPVLERINELRRKYGSPPLTLDPKVTFQNFIFTQIIMLFVLFLAILLKPWSIFFKICILVKS